MCCFDALIFYYRKNSKKSQKKLYNLLLKKQKSTEHKEMNFETKYYLNSVSLDCVVFGFHDNQLKVLLLKMKFSHEWALPGGFVQLDESVENAAKRVLKERTGLDNIFLKQFRVFSDPHRSKMNPAVA